MSTILGLKPYLECLVLLLHFFMVCVYTMRSLLCNFCKTGEEIILEDVVSGLVAQLCSGQGYLSGFIRVMENLESHGI